MTWVAQDGYEKGCSTPDWQTRSQVTKGWEGRAGDRGLGLPKVTEGGCSSSVASLITAGFLDRDMGRPWHTPVFSLLQHSTRDYRTDKISPTYTLLCSYRELKAPSSHGEEVVHPFCPRIQGLGKTWTPGIKITAGKSLVVGGWGWWRGWLRMVVSLMDRTYGQETCLWDGQPWCEAGRDWAEKQGLLVAMGVSALFLDAPAFDSYITRQGPDWIIALTSPLLLLLVS